MSCFISLILLFLGLIIGLNYLHFFKYPDSVRKLIYTTNPIESLNATIKRKTKAKGSFPTEDSAFKVMYLATQEQQNKWNTSSIRNWPEIYPQLSIFFSEIMAKYERAIIAINLPIAALFDWFIKSNDCFCNSFFNLICLTKKYNIIITIMKKIEVI